MRRWILCSALTAALAAGCSDAASPAAQPLRPFQPRPVAQNCAPNFSVEYPAYVRTLDILRRSGEMQRASDTFATMRRGVEAMLVERKPDALVDAKLVLDPLFSAGEVRKRAACEFTQYARDKAIVDVWDAWVADRALLDIHTRIVADAAADTPKTARVGASRRELLRRVWAATGLTRFPAVRQASIQDAQSIVKAALDPASPVDRPYVRPPAPLPTAQDEQAAIEQWLAPRLDGVSDAELQRHLAFAESEAGRAFYQSLRTTYLDAMDEWYGQLRTETKTKIAPKVAALGSTAVVTGLGEARRLLDTVGTAEAVRQARDLLSNLDMHDPKNAELQTLRGRVELDTLALNAQYTSVSPYAYEKGRIREAVTAESSKYGHGYERPEAPLLSAIALAPDNAEARVYMGRLMFVQSKDAEAAKWFAEAKRLAPDDPTLALFEADLAYATGQFAKAERMYRGVLAKPEGRVLNHYRALQHLGYALDALGRGREYAAVAKAQLQAHPEVWELRVDYVDDLLDRGGSAAEAMAVIEPIPKTWDADRMHVLLTRVQLQKVIEAAPSARAAVAKRWEATSFDTEAVGKALCRSPEPAVIDTVVKNGPPDSGAHIARAMLGCAVLDRRTAAVAAALPHMADINEPLGALWQDTALCGAVGRRDFKTLPVLLKAKVDRERRCTDSNTAQERLAAMAAKGDADARAAMAEFQRYPPGPATTGRQGQ